MMPEGDAGQQGTQHLHRLLWILLVLLVTAVTTVAFGSYWLLRQAALDHAVADANERLDGAFAKIGNEPPGHSPDRIYFPLLHGRATAPPEAIRRRQDGDLDTVVQHVEIATSRPERILAFNPGTGQPPIFDPPGLTAEIERIGDGRVQLRRTVTVHDGGEQKTVTQLFVGAERRWNGHSASLIAASPIRPVNTLYGQIAAFTGLVMLLLALSIALVLLLAQRTFARQIRLLREASIKISKSDASGIRLPDSDRSELGQLSAHMNGMIDTIEARGQLIRQQSFELDHDYREPLAMLIAYARLAQKQLMGQPTGEAPGSAVSESIDHIRKTAELMDAAATERLQLYSFVVDVTDGLPDTLERLDLPELAEDVCDGCSLLADARGVPIALEAASSCHAYGSHALISRALANLVRNAVEMSSPGASVIVRVLDGSAGPCLEVEDEAGGLPESVLVALATEATAVRSKRAGGTGIGLSLTKYTMVAHRGELTAENTRNGAKMRLVFSPGLPSPEMAENL